MKYPVVIFIILCCMFAGAVSSAENNKRLYHVEIIVFSQYFPDAQASESFQNPREIPDFEGSMVLMPPTNDDEPREFHLLKQSEFRLLSEKKRLQRSQRYQPLIHLAWRQYLEDKDLAKGIRITNNVAKLDGTLKIVLSRYLHAQLDFIYSGNQLVTYRLNEKRRIRSGEIHYFDHPVFGAILLVSPVEADS